MEGFVGMGSAEDDFQAATTEANGDSGQYDLPPLPSYTNTTTTQIERTYSHDNYGGFSTPSSFDPESNGISKHLGNETEALFSSAGNGPLLPDRIQMREDGAAFREWRRQNAVYLEEKEKEEKELRNQVIAEAEEFKRAFIEKRKKNIENNTALNVEREKNQDKFHKEADKQYWKAIAELIPREVANSLDKRRAKKKEKEDGGNGIIVVIQGPKPGKPTDLSRMRQLCMKLKQNPPPHMIPPPQTDTKDQSSKHKPEEEEEAKTNA